MNKFVFSICLFIFLVPGFNVFAQDIISDVSTSTVATTTITKTELTGEIIVSPSIIDEQFKVKELGKYDVVITNNTSHKTNIYPVVNNISMEDGKQKFATLTGSKRDKSLANWISFKRGAISLMPGEEMTVPLKIQVAVNASPGKYYAAISLPEGSNRSAAESSMKKKNYAQVMISVEITEDVIEKAQIETFAVTRGVFFNFPVDFDIKIDNFGNKKIDPRGSIYVYNRRGEEEVVLDVNSGDVAVQAEDSNTIQKSITEKLSIGKYKAKIALEYGENSTRDLKDTVYFWFLPWKFLLGFLGIFLFLVILSTLFLHRKTYRVQNHNDSE